MALITLPANLEMIVQSVVFYHIGRNGVPPAEPPTFPPPSPFPPP
ncbi:unnamed protein product [Spirodela intermedia]|uniref:Uncharacterized protein n=1 Tax=Spirodela intermedia TaxID=51605 RepID=A0A7I8JYA7_SPIIN|nr:unnamed protein product [Spirodela intermedia]